MTDLKIYPIKVNESRLNRVDKGILPSIPFLMCIIGRVKAGKSILLNSLALSPRFYGDDFQIKVLISPTAHSDPVNEHMVKEFDFVFTEYNDELLDNLLNLIEEDESKDRWLIIFDDIIGNMDQKKAGKVDSITALSTKYRHIGNENFEGKLSIMIATQYFKFLSPILRNNCSAYFLMGSYSQMELKKISEALSFFGGDEMEFLKLYKKSRQKPHDFLYLSVEHLKAHRNFEEELWDGDSIEFDIPDMSPPEKEDEEEDSNNKKKLQPKKQPLKNSHKK